MTIKIKGFGSKVDNQISDFESKFGVNLPNDYREFLKKYNGGIPNEKNKSIRIKEINEEIMLGVLFGLELESDYDLIGWNEEYNEDLIENTVIIGAEYGSGLLILIRREEEKGIYYWDNALELESSSEEKNTYKLCDTFDEFLKKVTCNEK